MSTHARQREQEGSPALRMLLAGPRTTVLVRAMPPSESLGRVLDVPAEGQLAGRAAPVEPGGVGSNSVRPSGTGSAAVIRTVRGC